MYSVNEDDIKTVELKGRSFKLLASKETVGCRNSCAGVSFFPAGKHAPGHIHDVEEEVIYCLEGSGEAIINDDRVKIKQGTVVYFPPGSLHSINNTGKDTIKLLFMFSPSVKIGEYKDYESK